jgi:hypothetical protein
MQKSGKKAIKRSDRNWACKMRAKAVRVLRRNKPEADAR